MIPFRERLERADGLGILVDPQDRWLLAALVWRISTKGYVEASMTIGYKRQITVKLHHFIVGAPIWEGDETDHRNRNRLDNRRQNLSITTRLENRQNCKDLEDGKHIRLHKGIYEVRISRMGEKLHRSFHSEKEAREYRDAVLNQNYHGRGKERPEHPSF